VRAQIPATTAPRPPATGSGIESTGSDWAFYGLLAVIAAVAVTGGASAWVRSGRR